MKITTERFLETWMQAHRERHNAIWVAQTLDLKSQAVYWRAASLRRQGYKLPKLPRFDETEKLRFNDLVAKEKNITHLTAPSSRKEK